MRKKMTEQEKLVITKYDLFYEQRITRVESIVENLKDDAKEIKTDLRWILGLMISFSTIIIGIMAKGFHWI